MAPTAAVIIIGNEILSGRTKDTNLNYAALGLAARGIRLVEARMVRDVEAEIVETVNALRARVDYVFTSGGIGPTHDDITSACVAKAFGQALTMHDEARRLLEEFYKDTITPARLRMAQMAEGVEELIPNPVSTAPGYRVGNVYVMAGIPRIFQAMFDWVLPRLEGGAAIVSSAVSAYLPESMLAAGLTEIQGAFPQLDVGSYPQMVNEKPATTIVVRGTDGEAIAVAIEQVRGLMRLHGSEIIEGEFS